MSDLIADPDPNTRKAAAKVLTQIDPDATLTAYAQALFGPEEAVRLEAAEYLLKMGAAAKPREAALIAAAKDDRKARQCASRRPAASR